MAVATNTLKPQLLVLKKGEYVFEEGDEAIFAYVLTEGVIEIVATSKGEEQVLAKLEKGTIFGEMAIIDGFPRSASARAAGDCKVQEVGHKEFLHYISKKPDSAFSIMTRLSGFVRSADKQASESFLLRKTGANDQGEDQKKDKTDSAIASVLAAKIYGLEIIKSKVENESGNVTRFFIMEKDTKHPERKDKKYITSCIFKLKSIPAALYKALGGFATNGVNLCKLESFSVKNTFDQVNFYIDIEGHIEESSLQKALEELGFHTQKLDVLGVYEAHQFRFENK